MGEALARASGEGEVDLRLYLSAGSAPFVALDEEELIEPSTIVALLALQRGDDADTLAGDTFAVRAGALQPLT
ncbi:MAG TPA: hypothetical protein VEQ11_15515 [Chloroflexota bacterium]|nr:hypothetical protein [Chloroflexota bacterium]